jgi:hypothetical protein
MFIMIMAVRTVCVFGSVVICSTDVSARTVAARRLLDDGPTSAPRRICF